MYGVVTRVTINSGEAATSNLRENLVPRVKQAPGFKTGYWLRKDGSGLSVIICESEEAAEAIRDQIQSAPLDGVSLDDIEVREVVASA
jgi:hypothetical protein